MQIRIRNIVLAGLMGLLISSELKGQHSFGIHAGGTLATMDFTDNPEYRLEGPNYLEGFQGGVIYQYAAKPHFGIRAEFNYVQRGWKEKTDTITGLKYQRRINYLELPFLTHIYIGKKKFRMMLDIGPYAAYALSSKETITDTNAGSSESNKLVFDKEKDNRLDYGLIIGGGFEYRMEKGAIIAEARYTFGLGNISKEKTIASELSQNRVIAIMVGYLVNIGKKDRQTPTPNTDQQ